VILGAAVTALGVIGLLVAERRENAPLRWVFKPLASAGFLLAALRAPALELPTGTSWLLLAGLVLSATGDVLLVPKGRGAFIGGIAAFALAHVAYAAWFVTSGTPWWLAATLATVLVAVGHLVWRWLDPHVEGALRGPVRGYVALVSIMAGCALAFGAHTLIVDGTAAASSDALVPLAAAAGGVLFYLSDLAVARHRFVKRAFVNRAWGLPVYYVAQLLIASAIG
jgi:uncharacterized membrane protein YhhN